MVVPSRGLIRYRGEIQISGQPPRWLTRYLAGAEVQFPPAGHVTSAGLETAMRPPGRIESEGDLLEAMRALRPRDGYEGFAILPDIPDARDWTTA